MLEVVYSLVIKGKVTYQGNVRMIGNASFELFLKGFGVTETISSGYPPLVILLSVLTDSQFHGR